MRQAQAIRCRRFESRGRWSHGVAGHDGAPWRACDRAGRCRGRRAVGQAAVSGRQEKRPAGYRQASGMPQVGDGESVSSRGAHSSLMRVSIFRPYFSMRASRVGRESPSRRAACERLPRHWRRASRTTALPMMSMQVSKGEGSPDWRQAVTMLARLRCSSLWGAAAGAGAGASSYGPSPSWMPFPVPTGERRRPGAGTASPLPLRPGPAAGGWPAGESSTSCRSRMLTGAPLLKTRAFCRALESSRTLPGQSRPAR